MSGTSALALTYDRKGLLAQCLAAIVAPSEPPDEIAVLDNGSSDGTRDYLCRSGLLDGRRILAYGPRENVGPAADFDLLFWVAGGDWLRCVDDDVIPSRDVLKELKGVCRQFLSARWGL